MPVLDVWPVETPEGDGHWSGIECPCCPWDYRQDSRTVVVHGWFTEQIIHTSQPEAYDDATSCEVEWEIQQ